ncbi:TraR/DksA family transcriptional regulator [Streptomyces sp. B21-083]|uniref:TraR/DksA family transcriptional regulator n=1 Tax=Streptomyces sp. B21-083 TaxID=3039410 RepID=UPI002FF03425
MSLDTPRTDPRSGHPADHDVRQRLDHARITRLAQLQALDEAAQSPDDHLMTTQKEGIQRVLQEIDNACARVEDGTYGACQSCAKSIAPERLEILPHTPYCVTCLRRTA